MQIIKTPGSDTFSGQIKDWVYNGLDCCVTAEVAEALLKKLAADKNAARIYAFERAMQKPAMTMQLRGVRVDEIPRRRLVKDLNAEAKGMQKDCDAFYRENSGLDAKVFQARLTAVTLRYAETEDMKPKDRPIAERKDLRKQKTTLKKAILAAKGFTYKKALEPSSMQIQKLFYGVMGIPKHRNKKGVVSMDKEVLKRISKKYAKARPLCQLVSNLRDSQKQIEVLTKAISPDGRMRACWNVGATETGRWSSSADPFMEGTNLQNQDRRVRHIYIADPGMEYVNADGEQAESRCIAYLAEDQNYIDAHENGNVHLEAGRNFWENDLDWNGYDAHDAKLAKYTAAPWIQQPEVPEGQKPAFNYYDMSKRGQHGLNYGLTPNGLAIWLGCTRIAAEELYEKYFTRYPGIADYHKWVAAELKECAQITTPLGRTRQFFERPWEKSTVREALANTPQSMTSDIIKIGMIRVWQELDPDSVGHENGRFQLLMDGHDAILGQMRLGDIETARRVKALMRVEVPVHGKIMVIPISVEHGPNWQACKEYEEGEL